MTPERLDKCRRIAVNFGWKVILVVSKDKDALTNYVLFKPKVHDPSKTEPYFWALTEEEAWRRVPDFYTDEAANALIRDAMLKDYSLSYVRQTDGTMLLQVECFDHVICANVMECNCEAFLKLLEAK